MSEHVGEHRLVTSALPLASLAVADVLLLFHPCVVRSAGKVTNIEVDYEALPMSAGLGINMLAGAMVGLPMTRGSRERRCPILGWLLASRAENGSSLPCCFSSACSLPLKAGISEHAVMFPIDSIKVRLPSLLMMSPLSAREENALLTTTTFSPFRSFALSPPHLAFPFPPTHTQTRMQVLPSTPSAVVHTLSSSIRKIRATEGLPSLWRGVNSVILGAGPAHAVYFGTYEIVKEAAGGNRPGHQFAATGERSWLVTYE